MKLLVRIGTVCCYLDLWSGRPRKRQACSMGTKLRDGTEASSLSRGGESISAEESVMKLCKGMMALELRF